MFHTATFIMSPDENFTSIYAKKSLPQICAFHLYYISTNKIRTIVVTKSNKTNQTYSQGKQTLAYSNDGQANFAV